MLKRKIESKIINWINNDKKALLIDGARQVGKTYTIRKVLEENNCDYIEFNLINSKELVTLIDKTSTVDELVTNLSLFTDKPFIKGKTFIFFDEIQEYKEIVTMIKFWVDEGSFRYILSGSLLGVELKNIRSAPVGYLATLHMYPMDFEEFLQIYNFSYDLKHSLYESYKNKKPLNDIVHNKMMQIFNTYLCVGGMPEAVNKYSETKNLDDVIKIHFNIVYQYKKDYTKYENEQKRLYLNKIYDSIPVELNKQNKRFILADLKKGLRYEKSEEDFLWLTSAGVALAVYNVNEPTMPLKISESYNLFKLFLSDVGILTSLYGKTTKIQLLSNSHDINYGAVYENVAVQELKAHDFTLNYYNSKKYGELDFVVEYNGQILPIEVKSGKNYKRHSALCNIMEISNYSIKEAFVLTNRNIEVVDNYTYYPIYMLMFIINNDIELPIIEIDDLSNIDINIQKEL